jgi:GNAT superfamily N-acetyltransferase
MPYEVRKNPYLLSTDKSLLDHEAIAGFLARAYWSSRRPREVIERSIEHSLCFGLYLGARQVGFARVVSDYAVFAYLCDVFIDEPYRGDGLGKWLLAGIMAHPDLQGLERWALATRDAHGLYRQFGWTALASPQIWMEIHSPRP